MGDKEKLTSILAKFDITSQVNIHNFLKNNNFFHDTSEDLIIRKVINYSQKRSKVCINDQLVTLDAVMSLRQMLFAICSQHSYSSLLETNSHITILDNYIDNLELLPDLKEAYKKMVTLKNEKIKLE